MKNSLVTLFASQCQIFLAFIVVSCSSCSSQQLQKGSEALPHLTPSMQRLVEESSQEHPGVIIASTVNFFGKTQTQKMSHPRAEGRHDLKIHVGGLKGLRTYIEKSRDKFGEKLILLDAGQKFYSKNHPQNDDVMSFYESFPYAGLTLNPLEKKVFEKSPKTSLPLIVSNLLHVKDGKPVEEGPHKNYRILEKGNLKLAIAGIIFPSALKRKDWQQAGKFYEDPVLTILKLKETLKPKRIDHLIVLAQVGKKRDIQNFLKRLPPKTVSLVVAGGPYQGPSKVEGVPVFSNQGRGQYLSVGVLDKEKAHTPHTIKLCTQFYRTTRDCFLPVDRNLLQSRIRVLEESNFALEEARFLGESVEHFKDK